MEKSENVYFWIRIGIVVFFAVAIFLRYILPAIVKRRKDEDDPIPLVEVRNFAPTPDASNEDFIDYLCAYAKQQNVAKSTQLTVEYFFVMHFNSIKFSYVQQTGKMLMVSDVEKCIKTATAEYLNLTN